MKTFINVVSSLFILALFTACGGGGGDGTVPPPPPPAPTYHYYTGEPTATSAIGGLYSVSSAAPSMPASVNANALAGGNRNTTIDTGTFDPLAGTLSNMHTYAVVFVADGKFYKQVANTSPAPQQISNVSNIGSGKGDGTASATATDLCNLSTMPDIASPENSVVIYQLAGTDHTCNAGGDDTYWWLRLSTNTSTSATALNYQPIAPVFSSAGALTSYVALDAGALVKLDANFATPTMIDAGPFSAAYLLGHLSTTRMILLLGGAGTVGAIRIVDASTNGATGVLGNITNVQLWTGTFAYDADYLYFVDNDVGGTASGTIQRIALNPPTNAVDYFDVSAWRGETVAITDLYLTPTRVIVGGTAGGGYGIASITKAGLTPVVLAGTNAGEGMLSYGVSATGYVYYTRGAATPDTYRAEAVSDDGAITVSYGAANGAEWNALRYPSTLNAFTSTAYLNQLVVAEFAAGATYMDGATLSVVNAADGAKNGTVVGTVPAGIISIYGPYNNSAQTLWTASDSTDSEIFYVDTNVSGSLTRVTNDSVNQLLIE